MKVIPKMASVLVLLMLVAGSASVVSAKSADDTTSYEVTVGDDNEVNDTGDINEGNDMPEWHDNEASDDGTTDTDTGDEELVYLHGTGTLFAMGSGRAILRGTGGALIFGEEVTVIVSSNAWVRALGEWKVEYTEYARVKYTGSGVLQILGHQISVDISGDDISLKASGRGSATLKGDWNYWVVRGPRLRAYPYSVDTAAITSRLYAHMEQMPKTLKFREKATEFPGVRI